jgi:hypothetical protein
MATRSEIRSMSRYSTARSLLVAQHDAVTIYHQ